MRIGNSSTQQPLWTAQEVADATGGTIQGNWTVTGVALDSRKLVAGDLYVAICGPQHDGHDFIAAALAAGAGAALVDHIPFGLAANAPLLIVPDTQTALENLARAARRRSRGRIVAITGSVGKTGTKEMLGRAFGVLGQTVISQGNLNNHYGLPLSLARLPADSDFGIFELGMNHPGEIATLTRLVQPHLALITRISHAHSGFFTNLDAIAAAKAEIFQGLSRNGVVVLNRDDPYFSFLVKIAKQAGATQVISFGTHDAADVALQSFIPDAKGSDVTVKLGEEIIPYRLGQPGRHWVLNSLAVLAAIKSFKGDVRRASASLAWLPDMKGRGKQYPISVSEGGVALLIDESYNASPAACRAAIETLSLVHQTRGAMGRRVAILADMLELGTESKQKHRDLAMDLLECKTDLVFAIGLEMRFMYETLPAAHRGGCWPDVASALAQLTASLTDGDTVLVKGSFGMGLTRLVDSLRISA